MSWWVKNHIAVNDDETKQLCSIQCDTQTSLPAVDQTATAGFIIVRGSDALVVDTGDRYILDSSGTWRQQPSGVQLDLSGYATTQDLTDGLADKVDTLTYTADQQRQETEIGVVAAQGAKNVLNNQYLVTNSSTGVTITDNGDGTYNLSGTPTGTATYLYTPAANFSSLYGLKIGNSYTITSDSNKVLIRIDYSTNGTSWDNGEDGKPLVSNIAGGATFTVPASTIGLYIRFRSTASLGSLNGIIFRPMIRRAEITDSTYAPYAPTNRELYEEKITLEDVFGTGKPIPDNADLNDYTTIGNYYGGNSAGNTVLNLPVANGSFTFSLEVKQATPAMTYQYLRVCRLADDPYIYCRRRYNSWGAWYRFEGVQV